jgi:hypothetical protein
MLRKTEASWANEIHSQASTCDGAPEWIIHTSATDLTPQNDEVQSQAIYTIVKGCCKGKMRLSPIQRNKGDPLPRVPTTRVALPSSSLVNGERHFIACTG